MSRQIIQLVPFISKNITLPDHYWLAKMRLGYLLKRMIKNHILMKKYDTILKDYLYVGIIERASNILDKGCVYLHSQWPVICNDRETRKFPKVPDRSARFIKQIILQHNILDPRSCLLLRLLELIANIISNKLIYKTFCGSYSLMINSKVTQC